MTKAMMDLRALMEKSPDADFLREMIGYGAQRLMELEVGGLIGAAHGEKSAERLRPKLPKLATLLDESEAEILAYMSFPGDASGEAALDQSDRAA